MPPIPDVNCEFDAPPLMLALGQITFTQSPEIFEKITTIKAAIADLGMPVARQRQQVVTVKLSGSAPSRVSQSSIWWFTNLEKTRAFAVAQNSLVLYDASYTRFDDFNRTMSGAVKEIVQIGGKGCFLTTIALRYLSGFPSDGEPSPYLVAGLHGLPPEHLETTHFHHDYNFWCATENEGKLVLSAKTVHGDQLVPSDMHGSGIAFDPKFTLDKKVHAVQLDIHETRTRKELKNFDAPEIERILGEMRRNIKWAFLSATTSKAHELWKIRYD